MARTAPKSRTMRLDRLFLFQLFIASTTNAQLTANTTGANDIGTVVVHDFSDLVQQLGRLSAASSVVGMSGQKAAIDLVVPDGTTIYITSQLNVTEDDVVTLRSSSGLRTVHKPLAKHVHAGGRLLTSLHHRR